MKSNAEDSGLVGLLPMSTKSATFFCVTLGYCFGSFLAFLVSSSEP